MKGFEETRITTLFWLNNGEKMRQGKKERRKGRCKGGGEERRKGGRDGGGRKGGRERMNLNE